MRFSLSAVLCVVVGLFGCGGGGAADSGTVVANDAGADTTAPVTVASPAGGTVASGTLVTLTCSEQGGCSATHFTLDGTTPELTSPRYTAPLNIAATTTLRFFSVDLAGNTEAPKTELFTVLTTLPETSATGLPDAFSNLAALDVDVAVNGADTGTYDFTLTLAGAVFASGTAVSAATNITTSALTDGEYLLSITGHAFGQADAAPFLYTFSIDRTAPETTALNLPAASTNSTGLSVDVKLDGAGRGTYDFTLTRGATTVASAQNVNAGNVLATSGLTDGAYVLSITGIDRAGNVDATPLSFSFTVDSSGPDTSALQLPAPRGKLTSFDIDVKVDGAEAGSYSHTLTRNGASVSGGNDVAASTNLVLTGLTEGTYLLRITGRDAAGNIDTSPLAVSFLIDLTPPNTTATGLPLSNSNAASLNVTVLIDGTNLGSYDYVLERAGVVVDGQTGVDASLHILSSALIDGAYTLTVTGRDEALNADPTPLIATFTLDTAVPQTTATGLPPALSNLTSATIDVAIDGTNSGTYDWALTRNGATFSGAANVPAATDLVLTALTQGAWSLTITGRSLSGTLDPTPVVAAFTIDVTAPETSASGLPAPAITTSSLDVTVLLDGVSSGGTYDYTLVQGTTAVASASDVTVATHLTATGLVEGAYTLTITGRDAVGNVDATPLIITFSIDTSATETTATGTPAGYTTSASLSVNVLVDGDSSTGTYDYTLIRYPSTTEASGVGISSSVDIVRASLVDGAYVLTITGRDPRGLVDASPLVIGFTVDTAPPDTSASGLLPAQTNLTSINVDVSVDADTNLGRYDSVLTFNGAVLISSNDVPATTNVQLGGLAQGTYVLTLTGKDNAGNTDPTPVVSTFVVDTTPPETTFVGVPSNPTNVTSLDVAVQADGTEIGTYAWTLSLAGVTVEQGTGVAQPAHILVAGLAAGSYVLTATSTDLAGNVDLTAVSFSFVIDLTAPETTLGALPAANTRQRTTNIQVFIDGTRTAASGRYNATLSLDGGAAIDAGSGVLANVAIAASGLVDGTYTVSVEGLDPAGNIDLTPATATWVVDNVAPVVTATGVPSGLTNVNSFTADVKLDGLDLGNYTYILTRNGSQIVNSGGAASIDLTRTSLSDGNYVLTITGSDLAGNVAAGVAFSWTQDTVAPNTSATNLPPAGTNVTLLNVDVLVDGNTNTGNYDYTLTRDGVLFDSGTNVLSSVNITTGGLTEARYVLTITARDAAGNLDLTPVIVTFAQDLTPPSLTVTSPVTGSLVRNIVTLTGTASDGTSGSGIAEVRVELDGNAYDLAAPSDTWSYSLNFGGFPVPEGDHLVTVTAVDAAGNASVPQTITLQLDRTTPMAHLRSAIVTVTEPFVFTFEEPIRPASFVISGMQAHSLTFNATNTMVTLTPTTVWNPVSNVVAVVNVTDLAGNVDTFDYEAGIVPLAGVIHVSPGTGDDTTGDGSITAPFRTIPRGQSALEAIQNTLPSRGVVRVDTSADAVLSAPVTLTSTFMQGGWDSTFSARAGQTRVYQPGGVTFHCTGSTFSHMVIEGFDLGNPGVFGNAMTGNGASNLTFHRNTFQGNITMATGLGGPTFRDSVQNAVNEGITFNGGGATFADFVQTTASTGGEFRSFGLAVDPYGFRGIIGLRSTFHAGAAASSTSASSRSQTSVVLRGSNVFTCDRCVLTGDPGRGATTATGSATAFNLTVGTLSSSGGAPSIRVINSRFVAMGGRVNGAATACTTGNVQLGVASGSVNLNTTFSRNRFEGSLGCNAGANRMETISVFANGQETYFDNNFIQSGQHSGTPDSLVVVTAAVSASSGGKVHFLNNTFSLDDGIAGAAATSGSFYGFSTAAPPTTRTESRNNLFVPSPLPAPATNVLYTGAVSGFQFNTNNALYNLSPLIGQGNFNVTPVFVNSSQSVPRRQCNLYQGGVSTFALDYFNVTRTPAMTCGSTLSGAAGFSVGAAEREW